MAEPAGQEQQEGKKKGGSKLILLLGLLLVVGLGAGAFIMFKRNAELQAELAKQANGEEEEEPNLKSVTYALKPQTVNLADGDRYVRCRISLEFKLEPVDVAHFRTWLAQFAEEPVPETPDPTVEELPKKAEPSEGVKLLTFALATRADQIDDAVIRELGSRSFEELLSEDDKDKMITALKKRFTDILSDTEMEIASIYLTEFVMQ